MGREGEGATVREVKETKKKKKKKCRVLE